MSKKLSYPYCRGTTCKEQHQKIAYYKPNFAIHKTLIFKEYFSSLMNITFPYVTSDTVFDIIKIDVKNMSIAVLLRRVLWLKSWSADMVSKNRLLSIAFEGKLLFGSKYDSIIKTVTEGVICVCLRRKTATMIYVDQRNGDLLTSLSSKDQSTELVASRKALGNVNKQVVPQKVAMTLTALKKLKRHAAAAKKAAKLAYLARPRKEDYPEIENFSPYNPTDFERFEVPEEHRLSHICLAGIPHMVHEKEMAKFEALINLEPAPMNLLLLPWESDTTDTVPTFLAGLEEITLEMPPIDY
ncbi:securin-like [Bombina bombina]|uniref:securin-like n=1 Tax=Bombina bombina TaxID=8345 RepID=UPI00235A7A0C|nr:securin-like [Bombina bombina]